MVSQRSEVELKVKPVSHEVHSVAVHAPMQATPYVVAQSVQTRSRVPAQAWLSYWVALQLAAHPGEEQ